jgi:hypothetical protein
MLFAGGEGGNHGRLFQLFPGGGGGNQGSPLQALVANGGGNNSGLFQLSPSSNISASTNFYSEAQKTSTYITDINTASQLVMTNMSLLMELAHMADAMEKFHARLEITMNCLLAALMETGLNLEFSSEDTTALDTQWKNIYQQIENQMTPSTTPALSQILNPVPNLNIQTPTLQYPGFDTNPLLLPGNSTQLQPSPIQITDPSLSPTIQVQPSIFHIGNITTGGITPSGNTTITKITPSISNGSQFLGSTSLHQTIWSTPQGFLPAPMP